jgi:hypothetical protein
MPPNEKQANSVLYPAVTTPRLPKIDIGVAAAQRYPRVSAELTCTEHCSVPSSGRIAATSCIPLVRVEPIPLSLDDMAWCSEPHDEKLLVLDEGWANRSRERWPRGTVLFTMSVIFVMIDMYKMRVNYNNVTIRIVGEGLIPIENTVTVCFAQLLSTHGGWR